VAHKSQIENFSIPILKGSHVCSDNTQHKSLCANDITTFAAELLLNCNIMAALLLLREVTSDTSFTQKSKTGMDLIISYIQAFCIIGKKKLIASEVHQITVTQSQYFPQSLHYSINELSVNGQ
jgi:hypothetical protein